MQQIGTAGRATRNEPATGYLYWWLLIAVVFEYARPGLHFAPLQAVPLNSTIPLTLFVITLFAKGLRPWGEIFADPMVKWPFVFLGVISISILYSDVGTYTYNVAERVLGYVFLLLMVARIVTTRARLRGLFLTLILAHLFLIATNPEVVLDPTVRHYIVGATFLGDGNDFSLSLCILVPMAIDLALGTESRFRKVVLWGIVGVLVLTIVATQSRGAALGIVGVFGYMWWRSPRKGLSAVAIVIVAIGALAYAPSVFFDRMRTITNYEEETSALSRIDSWRAGLGMAMSNPLGVGAGNYPNSFPKYRPADARATNPNRYMTAHSMYFLVLGELGFPTLALYVWTLIIGNVRRNARIRDTLAAAGVDRPEIHDSVRTLNLLNTSIIGFAIAGAFLSVAYYPHIFVLIGMVVAQRSLAVNHIETKYAADARAGLPLKSAWRAHGS